MNIYEKVNLFYNIASSDINLAKNTKEIAQKIKEIKGLSRFNPQNKYTLKSLIIHLQQRIATQKVALKQKITDFIHELYDSEKLFSAELKNVAQAKLSGDSNMISDSLKSLQKSINKFAEAEPAIQLFVQDSQVLYIFRDNLKKLFIHFKEEEIDNLFFPIPKKYLDPLIIEGEAIINKFQLDSRIFPVLETVHKIVTYLKSRNSFFGF